MFDRCSTWKAFMCRYFRERGREKVKGGVFIETKSSYGDINFNIYWSILWYEGRGGGGGVYV
jgi:hypothetical protein